MLGCHLKWKCFKDFPQLQSFVFPFFLLLFWICLLLLQLLLPLWSFFLHHWLPYIFLLCHLQNGPLFGLILECQTSLEDMGFLSVPLQQALDKPSAIPVVPSLPLPYFAPRCAPDFVHPSPCLVDLLLGSVVALLLSDSPSLAIL